MVAAPGVGKVVGGGISAVAALAGGAEVVAGVFDGIAMLVAGEVFGSTGMEGERTIFDSACAKVGVMVGGGKLAGPLVRRAAGLVAPILV